MLSSSDNSVLRRDGDIGILELNNPPENYLTHPEVVSQEALKEFVDSGIAGLVVTGVGRHFSAGANPEIIIKQAYHPEKLKHNLIRGRQLLDFISTLNIPVVAAISGVCFGGGLRLPFPAISG
ncbi:MAG: enoyl-CoA hydratase/isomerase family protein [Bacteroidales bacterium]